MAKYKVYISDYDYPDIEVEKSVLATRQSKSLLPG